MSYKGKVVIDADSHIREYWDLDKTYKDNIDPEFRETYARFSAAVHGQQKKAGDVGFAQLFWPRTRNRPYGVFEQFEVETNGHDRGADFNPTITGRGYEIDPSCNWDPNIRLRDMTKANIDMSVMFPSQADGFCMLRDVRFESALHRAYHRFMSNYCAVGKGRLWWIGGMTMRNLDETVKELRKWAKDDPYFAGIHLPRAFPDGKTVDNPALYPFFAACQELDLPVWVHGGANRPPLTPWVEAPNGLYHAIGGQYALTALIGGGVFDLFPKLRVGIFESFAGWMPFLIERLDDGFTPGSAVTPKQKRTAAEIIAGGQVFCSVEADEEHIPYAVETFGEHVWLFSTDYPHGGSPWPDGVSMIDEKKMSESAKISLLGANALRFLPRLARVEAAKARA
jgi:predicted TIM-barrel fold metal-dependent hydrolase